MIDGKGNSGVQFRSVRVPPHEMSGYQADIGEGYWGSLYDESRRNKVLVPAQDAHKALNKTDWNHYVVRAAGRQDRLSTQRQEVAVEYHEPDPAIARSGLLAVQIHAGGPMEVQFKNMMIQPLPTPDGRRSDRPGFHLRTVKTGHGDRKYHALRARGLRRSKTFPGHPVPARRRRARPGRDHAGAGGDRPGDPQSPGMACPALVVFPQARANLGRRIGRHQRRARRPRSTS